MAKKLTDLAKFVDSQALAFKRRLDLQIPYSLTEVIGAVAQETEVFVFSGIIRDFFLGIEGMRDIDLVLEHPVEVMRHFSGFPIERNSYGGYKIKFDEVSVDLWFLPDTWAYRFQKVFDFYLGPQVFQTAFFNFSQIVFSISESRFYYSKDFLRFLQNREIDVVFSANANYDLCIVNTIYYQKKLGLRITSRLKLLLVDLYQREQHDFQKVQQKHFGSVLFSDESIDAYIGEQRDALVEKGWLSNI